MIYLNTDFAIVIDAFSAWIKEYCNAVQTFKDSDGLIILWNNYVWEKIPFDITMMAKKLIKYKYHCYGFDGIDYSKDIKVRIVEDGVIFESVE